MHIAGLNLFKYYNINLFNEIKLKNCTNDVEAICDVEKKCLHKLRFGRWPYKPVENYTCYKIEEHKIFVQWIQPLVFKKCEERIQLGHIKLDYYL
jgi:hypothetical protein